MIRDYDKVFLHMSRDFAIRGGRFYGILDCGFEDGIPKREFITGFTTEPYEEGTLYPHDSFSMQDDQIQELFDSMWDVGIRPTKSQPATSQEAHIKDLRKITFALLEIPE